MADNVLTYKGYYTRIEYSAPDGVLYGQIEGINDLVTFDSESADGIEQSFHEAVDDYLKTCEEVGKSPDKAYKGIFNVRVTPETHRRASEAAIREGITLNQFVASAIERSLAHA